MGTQNFKIAAVIVSLLVLLIIVPYCNSFVILLATRAMAFAILAMSLDILLGFTGLASMGQAAYFGVGAYLTAILANNYGFGLKWDFWLMVPLGMAVGGVLAAFFGLFAIRATGTYFLMITLALGQCVWGLNSASTSPTTSISSISPSRFSQQRCLRFTS
jgi:branched-chain amino acid transport system permease protein